MSLKLAVLFCVIALASAVPQRPFLTHASKKRLDIPRQQCPDPSNVTRWFTSQLLDHFDAQVTAVWSQRYFVNESFFDGTGPVFLCVGGEGPWFEPDVVVTGNVHCADMILLAERVGALVLAIEHRYYGPPGSLPVPDFTTPNMRWLSSRQALADISLFHSHITQQFKLGPQNKWVAWGGSYPGMMAAFIRLKYANADTRCDPSFLAHVTLLSGTPLSYTPASAVQPRCKRSTSFRATTTLLRRRWQILMLEAVRFAMTSFVLLLLLSVRCSHTKNSAPLSRPCSTFAPNLLSLTMRIVPVYRIHSAKYSLLSPTTRFATRVSTRHATSRPCAGT